ncbi:MAG: hypothetical protein JSR45_03505 [Proteobacteria bacterium]|nr:hypothetical protein [Pseudomonadota bacterium]
MDLVTRYVNAVKALLPRDQREDIAAELTDAINTRLEERQAELGRKLTKAEQEAIIQEFGHPIFAASRYGPQRSLIGPTVYPVYLLALKWAGGIVLVMQLILFALRIAKHPFDAGLWWTQLWGGLFAQAVLFFGVVTLVFAAIERSGPSMAWFGGWKAADLPENLGESFGQKPGAGRPLTGDEAERRRRKRERKAMKRQANAAVGLFFTVLFGLYFLGLGLWPDRFDDAVRPDRWLEAMGLYAGPIWFPVLWGLLLTHAAIQVLEELAKLFRPHDLGLRSGPRLAGDMIMVVAAGVAFTWDPLFGSTAGGMPSAAVEQINMVAHLVCAVIAIASLADFARSLWNLLRPRPAEA